jgi:H+/Cl- antiporter ClcA
MGGALADQLAHRFKLSAAQRQVVLMAGIGAGFASVFGTPLAGALFALEVLAGPALRQMRWGALLPCTVAALGADQVSLWWGVQHTVYTVGSVPVFSAWGLCAVLLAGGLMGLAGRVFALSTHGLSAWMKKRIAYAPLRPLIGGAVIAMVVSVLPAERYLGLGIPVIVEAFSQPLAPWDFAAKLALTVASLGAGFKGGEVTPLFYIGATLGNALAPLLQMPVGLMAAVGFVAVFAGAAKTPLACTVMALELFGVEVTAFAAVACAVSYGFSGRSSIYKAQRQRPAQTPPPQT